METKRQTLENELERNRKAWVDAVTVKGSATARCEAAFDEYQKAQRNLNIHLRDLLNGEASHD